MTWPLSYHKLFGEQGEARRLARLRRTTAVSHQNSLNLWRRKLVKSLAFMKIDRAKTTKNGPFLGECRIVRLKSHVKSSIPTLPLLVGHAIVIDVIERTVVA
jgi:hypothetical protein